MPDEHHPSPDSRAEPVEALLFHAGVEGMPVGLGERGEMPDA
ncbi:hypothetical protein [Pseudomonas aeruginosa]